MISASQYVFLQSQGTERGGGREHGELHAAFLNASTCLSLTNVSFLAVPDVRGECSVTLPKIQEEGSTGNIDEHSS